MNDVESPADFADNVYKLFTVAWANNTLDKFEGAVEGITIAHDRLVAAAAARRERERCAVALRQHYIDYETALANPRDKEFDQGYLSGASNALFVVEELPDPEPANEPT